MSLGGIESPVVRPALMVQAAYTAHRDEYGVNDNPIRLAIGIEEIEGHYRGFPARPDRGPGASAA